MEENLAPLEDQDIDMSECPICLTSFDEGDGNETEDGLVCDSCYEDYSRCHSCEDIFKNDDMSSDSHGHRHCQSCYDDLDHCESCDDVGNDLSLTRINTRNGEECWCEGCADNNSFYCDNCNEYFSDWHCNYEVRRIGRVCESCRDNIGTFECQECNDEWPDSYCANPDDDSEDYICNTCNENGGGHIHSYSYKPRAKFHKADNEHVKDTNQLYFGIELEVERNGSSTDKGSMAKLIEHDSYYLKNDGSLSDGFEIVTHPLTFSYIQQNKSIIFSKMLSLLSSNGYRSYDSDTCGMHIHLSKKAFGTWQLYRFIKFFVDNKDFVTYISQRKSEQLNKWATIEEENDNAIIYKAKKKGGNSKRYVAINLQNDKTVELRIFRGTLNHMSFMKNIEFAYALFNFTRDCKDISLQSFKEYINQSNEYTMLKKFIKTKNL
jgi:hypothetical protein